MKLLYAVAALAALGSATPLGSVPNAAPIAASFPIDPPKQCTAFLELPRCCPEPTTDLKVSLGPLGVVFDDENGACKAVSDPPPRGPLEFKARCKKTQGYAACCSRFITTQCRLLG